MDIEEIKRMNRQAILEANGSQQNNGLQCVGIFIISTLIIYSLLVLLEPEFLMHSKNEGTNQAITEFSVNKAVLISAVVSLVIVFFI